MSQHDLALTASVSGRHVSFLETGRSQPSREMILRLCDVLDIPKQGRNAMLTAAGMAQIYGSRPLGDHELEPVRDALSWMLKNHMPYPAFAMDRHWNIVDLNDTARQLFSVFGVVEGENILEALLENKDLQGAVENFPEVATHLRGRAMLESAFQGGDHILEGFISRLDDHVDHKAGQLGTLPPFSTTRLKFGEHRLSFLTTLAQFGSANDILLADMRIELMFPSNEETADFLHAISA